MYERNIDKRDENEMKMETYTGRERENIITLSLLITSLHNHHCKEPRPTFCHCRVPPFCI